MDSETTGFLPFEGKALDAGTLQAYLAKDTIMADPLPELSSGQNHCPACRQSLSEGPLAALGDTPCPQCRHFLWFVRKRVGSAVVLTFLPGLVSGSEAVQRVDEIMSAASSAPRLVLNLGELRLVSSMLLGMLVVVYRRMLAAQRTLKLCGLRGENLDAFRITKLDWLFDICDNEEQALVNS